MLSQPRYDRAIVYVHNGQMTVHMLRTYIIKSPLGNEWLHTVLVNMLPNAVLIGLSRVADS